VGDFTAEQCPACGGLWIGRETFDRLLEWRARQDVPASAPPPRRAVDGAVYLKCPACGKHMNRRGFGNSAGVVIDECRRDGYWLDAGELEAIAERLKKSAAQPEDEPERRRTSSPRTRGQKRNPEVESPPLEKLIAALRGLLGSG
jgi:Zn-finger nucleic acid-binding protein